MSDRERLEFILGEMEFMFDERTAKGLIKLKHFNKIRDALRIYLGKEERNKGGSLLSKQCIKCKNLIHYFDTDYINYLHCFSCRPQVINEKLQILFPTLN